MNWRKTDRKGEIVVWCQTQQEVDDFLDIAEYEGVKWSGSRFPNLRDHNTANKPYVEYHIYPGNVLRYKSDVYYSEDYTVLGSDLHNYAISVRLKRGDIRD